VTISVFQTGSIIITGARNKQQLDEAYEFINVILRKHAAEVLKPLPTACDVRLAGKKPFGLSGLRQTLRCRLPLLVMLPPLLRDPCAYLCDPASAPATAVPLPSAQTLVQAAKLAIQLDRAIQLDYYVDTATNKAFLGEDDEAKEKMLVKSGDEFTESHPEDLQGRR
jgi:hypothetical protein